MGLESLGAYGGFHVVTMWCMAVRGEPLNVWAAGTISALFFAIPVAALVVLLRRERAAGAGDDRIAERRGVAGEGEVAMLEHMNSDHANAIAHYVELAGLPKDPGAEMVGIDTEGFHLRIGQTLHWLPFPTSCNNPGAVRQALVQLARAESWPTRLTDNLRVGLTGAIAISASYFLLAPNWT